MHFLFQLLISLSVLGFCLFCIVFEFRRYKKTEEYLKHEDELVLLQSSVLLKHLSEDI